MAVNKFFLFTSLITGLILLIIVVVGVVLYVKRSAPFTPYSYKGMDAQGTRYAPNGFEQSAGKINPAIQGILQTNLQTWQSTQNPSSNPDAFGYAS